MTIETVFNTGSSVVRLNKVRAGLLPLRQPVKSQLGRNGKFRKVLRLAEWNISRTLLDRNKLRMKKYLPNMADILIEKNLRWLGYVHRMEHSRLPRQLLYSQLKEGKRNIGQPRLRLKDVAKRNMNRRAINLSSCMAADS